MNAIARRIGSFVAALALGIAVSAGQACNVGQEGERCNPDLSHDECGAGLACTRPSNCPENYCCPTSGGSSNPYCQDGCNGGNCSIFLAGGDADPDGCGFEAGSTGSNGQGVAGDGGSD